jgi:plasmid stabilization system protein ParE
MTLPFEFHEAVRGEVREAFRWYRRLGIGLGRDFLDEVHRTLKRISENPARFGFADKHRREGVVKRFPYVIYYRVLRDRIRVVAIRHTSRDPSGWQSRN